MVAPAQNYYIRQKGNAAGPYTLAQLSHMWLSGRITADAFYRLTNVADWTPIGTLVETLESLATSKKADIPLKPVETAQGFKKVPSMTEENPDIILAPERLVESMIGNRLARHFGHRLWQVMGRRRDGQIEVWTIEHEEVTKDYYFKIFLPTSKDGGEKLTRKMEDLVHKRLGQVPASKLKRLKEEHMAFRVRWFFIHVTFWVFAGLLWLGAGSILGLVVSVFVFSIQNRWKAKQLMQKNGFSESEISKRMG